MLTGFPIYHYFKNGNAFSGAEGGMRYLIEPAKRPDPADESGEKTLPCLAVTIWPGPWSLEHTAAAKRRTETFAADQQGLDAAAAWLAEQYAAQLERWASVPSILDCEPDM